MRVFFILFFIFIGTAVFGQSYPPIAQYSKLYEFKNGIRADSAAFMPRRDTLTTDTTMKAPGMLLYDMSDSIMYYRNSFAWKPLLSSSNMDALQDSISKRWDSTRTKLELTIANPELLGILFDKSSFANTSDFVINGDVTASASGGVIAISTSTPGTLDQSFEIPVNSMLQYWNMKLIYKVNSAIGANTHGLGIGIRSVNTAVNSSVVSYVDLSNDALYERKLHIANTYPTNFTIVNRAPQQLVYSNGDTLELNFERQGNYFITSVKNLTTNSAYITTNFTFTTANTSQNMANTGRFAIFALGGNYDIQSLKIYSKEVKNSELMVIGDSKTQGYVADWANTWPNLLRTSFGSVVTSAGGGDKTTEVLSRLNEIYRLSPKQILLELGTNNPDTTIFKSDYQNLVSSLSLLGVPIYHMTFYTASNEWRNNFIKRTYSASSIIDTWSATKTPGSLGPDGEHLSNLGDSIIFKTILNSGKLTLRGKAYEPNPYIIGDAGFITKLDGNGGLLKTVVYENGKDIGVGLTTPGGPTGSRVLHLHDSASASSPTIHMTNGDIGAGNGAGTAIFVGNAASTGAGSFNIYNMDATSGIHFFTTSTNRFSILANGNIGVKNASPTSSLTVGGSLAVLGTTITTGTTLADFYIYNVANTTDITLNLPVASTCPWRIYSIKKTTNNANTINIHQASGTIDGSSSDVVVSAFNVNTVIYTDGTNWFIQ